MKVQPASDVLACAETKRATRQRNLALVLSAALACSAITSCTKGEIVASSIGIGAGVAIVVVGVTYAVKNHTAHNLQGCVFSDAGGLKLRTSDAQVFVLQGDIASLKAGERVKFHGSRVKKNKHDKAADQIFTIEKLTKDYGPCPAGATASSTR